MAADIYRYSDDDFHETFEVADPPAGWREAIEAHLERHLGPCQGVLHELISTNVHLDIYLFGPTGDHPYHTLVTLGMADAPQSPPEELPEYRHVELLCCLPVGWQLPQIGDPPAAVEQSGAHAEEWYWPIRVLKTAARFVHQYSTWLGPGHTIPNGDPAEPFAANTRLAGSLFVLPPELPDSFDELAIDGTPVRFLQLIPVTAGEMDLKLAHGAAALTACLDRAGHGGLIDVGRSCTTPLFEPADAEEADDGDYDIDRLLLQLPLHEAFTTTRRVHQAQRRKLGFWARRKLSMRKPDWLDRQDPLAEIYRQQRHLLQEGQVVWGQIVQANQLLFDIDNEDVCPAAMVYASDRQTEATPELLQRIAHRLFACKDGQTDDDPDLQRFGDLLADERERQLHLPVPANLCAGRPVIYTTVMIDPRQLPAPILLVGLLPLLIAPGRTEAALILPADLWSPEMLTIWGFLLNFPGSDDEG